ncbi:hypothetical protein GT632_02210 [Collinsella aerofaciens]|nr:hypothetical protein [Collinsella aerofaciens]
MAPANLDPHATHGMFIAITRAEVPVARNKYPEETVEKIRGDARQVLFCELCALKATFRGINYLPEAAAFRVRLTCTFNLRGRRGAARRRISPTCRGLQRCGPRFV